MNTSIYTNFPDNVLRLILESKISKTALKLYIFLRMYRNNGSGKAWPSVRRIVKEAHISRNQVKPAREELERLGVIHIEEHPGVKIEVTFIDEVLPIVSTGTVTHSREQGVTHSRDTTIKNTIKKDYYESTEENSKTETSPSATSLAIDLEDVLKREDNITSSESNIYPLGGEDISSNGNPSSIDTQDKSLVSITEEENFIKAVIAKSGIKFYETDPNFDFWVMLGGEVISEPFGV